MDQNNNLIRNRLNKKFRSLSLDKDELRNLLKRLQLSADYACQFEIAKVKDIVDEQEVKENVVRNLGTCSPLQVTLRGKDNIELFGSIDDVFDTPSFPEEVLSVYLNSELLYRSNYKYYVGNSFTLFINFSKSKVFDFSLEPSEITPNDSELVVEGSDTLWVNGVYQQVLTAIEDKPSVFPIIHKGGIYDMMVWFLGLPFGFWICYTISSVVKRISVNHPFIEVIFFTYCFFLSLFCFRILFQYGRWIFPMIEYRSKRSKTIAHRVVLTSISLGLIGKFIYDAIIFLKHL
jgi:hypothetical protein